MKSLKDFENALNKCSKCGLCQEVCPIFQNTQNDCAVSKGKFIMLHGVTKGELKLSENINKYLDMCLKCGKCKEFCPSGIDVCEVLNVAKAEYMRDKFSGKVIRFLQSNKVFSTFMIVLSSLVKPFRPKIGKRDSMMRVMYFKGCVNQICPRTDNYIHKIFKNSSIEVIAPEFDCCGLPFLSEGNMERFLQAAYANSQLLNGKYDYLVTDCASCESTVLDYPKYIECMDLSDKSINWGDLIVEKGFKFKFKKKIKVTFHKPCHLKSDDFFEKIMSNCGNVEYIKMDEYDSCCGFAGSFALKNRKLSMQISKAKGEKIKATKADYVITTCPACILGLKQGLIAVNSKTKVVSLLEFLAKANKITV